MPSMSSIDVALVTKCVASYSYKKQGSTVLSFYITAKGVLSTLITSKIDRFRFKSGCVVQVEKGEMRRQL